jgi:predicted RNase H-like HicB family nuclease
MPSVSLSAVLNPEESGGYVALCPELDIASQGESIEQAMHNLKEAVEDFFEVASPAEIETRLKRPALFTRFEISRARDRIDLRHCSSADLSYQDQGPGGSRNLRLEHIKS